MKGMSIQPTRAGNKHFACGLTMIHRRATSFVHAFTSPCPNSEALKLDTDQEKVLQQAVAYCKDGQHREAKVCPPPLSSSTSRWVLFCLPTRTVNHFDADRSGELDKQELKGVHADLKKHGLTNKEFDAFLADLDVSGDGKVGLNEYVDYLIREGTLRVKVLPTE